MKGGGCRRAAEVKRIGKRKTLGPLNPHPVPDLYIAERSQ